MSQDISLKSPFIGSNYFMRSNGRPFWQYLDSKKIDYQKNHFPFLTAYKKPRVKPVFDFTEYLKLNSRGEALGYLYGGLGKALNYVGPVLDQEMRHGFNDHTDRHTLWVSQTGLELLQRSGYSFDRLDDYFGPKSEILMTLVGMTHDLGNFIDRKNHSTYSAWLLTRLFQNTKKDPEMWHAVLYSILFHEEPVLVDLGLDLSNGIPLQWALVAADKMHVGRDRIGGRSFESGVENGALEEDAHILLNSMIVRSAWYLGVETFIWHLDFSIDQLEDKFVRFTRGNRRLWVPQAFQSLFRDRGRAYRDTFAASFTKLYLNRMLMAAQSVFLLFPFIKFFEVRLTDTDTRGKVGSGEMTIWRLSRDRTDVGQVFGHSKRRLTERWWLRG